MTDAAKHALLDMSEAPYNDHGPCEYTAFAVNCNGATLKSLETRRMVKKVGHVNSHGKKVPTYRITLGGLAWTRTGITPNGR